MSTAPTTLDVDGKVPDLCGLVCDAFLCQSYWHKGIEVDPANVVYLNFGGIWHRLYLDMGIVFWRPQDQPPEACEIPSEGWAYPLVNVGAAAGVIGVGLEDLEMAWSDEQAVVTFRFANRRSIDIVYGLHTDVTTYRVTGPDIPPEER